MTTITTAPEVPAWLNVDAIAPRDFLDRVEAAAVKVDVAARALHDALDEAARVLGEWAERCPSFDDAELWLADVAPGLDGPRQLRELVSMVANAAACAVGECGGGSHPWHSAQPWRPEYREAR